MTRRSLRRRISFIAAILLMVTGVACTDDKPAGDPDESVEGLTVVRPAQLSSGDISALESVPDGATVLDVSPSGLVLAGIEEATPPHTDLARVVSLRAIDGSQLPTEGMRVEDARFVDDDTILAITADALLIWVESDEITTIDTDAYGPLSVDEEGRFAAWVTGQMPFFEVVVRDLERGVDVFRSESMAPCSSPAVRSDGEVYFVSGATSWVELWRAAPGEQPQRLTDRQAIDFPIPTGASAPRWIGDTLVYESEARIYTVGLRDGSPGEPSKVADMARLPVLLPDGRLFVQTMDGALGAVSPDKLRGVDGP